MKELLKRKKGAAFTEDDLAYIEKFLPDESQSGGSRPLGKKNYTLNRDEKESAIQVQLTAHMFYVSKCGDRREDFLGMTNPLSGADVEADSFGCITVGWRDDVKAAWAFAKLIAKWE